MPTNLSRVFIRHAHRTLRQHVTISTAWMLPFSSAMSMLPAVANVSVCDHLQRLHERYQSFWERDGTEPIFVHLDAKSHTMKFLEWSGAALGNNAFFFFVVLTCLQIST